MRTVTIEITDDIAYGFLQNLEHLKVLRFVRPSAVTSFPDSTSQTDATPKTLADFRGAFSAEDYAQANAHIQQARKEWDRDF